MKQLELKHLAPYLPYGAMFQSSMDKPFDEFGEQPIWHLEGVSKLFGNYCLIPKNNNDAYEISSCRLILRPLSDLTKEIEHNGERFVPIDCIEIEGYTVGWNGYGITINQNDGYEFGYTIDVYEQVIQKLFEWHFNVFNLPKELFINYNEI